jgi:hypothetical protein
VVTDGAAKEVLTFFDRISTACTTNNRNKLATTQPEDTG